DETDRSGGGNPTGNVDSHRGGRDRQAGGDKLRGRHRNRKLGVGLLDLDLVVGVVPGYDKAQSGRKVVRASGFDGYKLDSVVGRAGRRPWRRYPARSVPVVDRG